MVKRRLIDVNELAELTGLSVHTLYTWVSQKRIPYLKVGRLTKFDLKVIEGWIDSLAVEPRKWDS